MFGLGSSSPSPVAPFLDTAPAGLLTPYHDPDVKHFGALSFLVHFDRVEVHLADGGHFIGQLAYPHTHLRVRLLTPHGHVAVAVEQLKPAYPLHHIPGLPGG